MRRASAASISAYSSGTIAGCRPSSASHVSSVPAGEVDDGLRAPDPPPARGDRLPPCARARGPASSELRLLGLEQRDADESEQSRTGAAHRLDGALGSLPGPAGRAGEGGMRSRSRHFPSRPGGASELRNAGEQRDRVDKDVLLIRLRCELVIACASQLWLRRRLLARISLPLPVTSMRVCRRSSGSGSALDEAVGFELRNRLCHRLEAGRIPAAASALVVLGPSRSSLPSTIACEVGKLLSVRMRRTRRPTVTCNSLATRMRSASETTFGW